MAITPISSQSTSAATVQNQEQQLLNQIKGLQSKNANGNAAQIKVLQQKYNALLLQQTLTVTPQAVTSQQKAPEASETPKAPEAPSASPAAGQGIDIKA